MTQRDPKRIIELLQQKANAIGVTPHEKEAIQDKIKVLREKYKIPAEEMPHTGEFTEAYDLLKMYA